MANLPPALASPVALDAPRTHALTSMPRSAPAAASALRGEEAGEEGRMDAAGGSSGGPAPRSAASPSAEQSPSPSPSPALSPQSLAAPPPRGKRRHSSGTATHSASVGGSPRGSKRGSAAAAGVTSTSGARGASSSSGPSAPPTASYSARLLAFSNGVAALFASSGAASLLASTQSQHGFTNSPAWILGQCHRLLASSNSSTTATSPAQASAAAAATNRRARFQLDWTSKLWFTYRRQFPQIGSSDYSSDAGWGCMIRSAQMMLGQVFVRHWLGRDWRRIPPPQLPPAERTPKKSPLFAPLHSASSDDASASASPEPPPVPPLPPGYERILSLFLDSPSTSCPYSIHNLLLQGQGDAQHAASSGGAPNPFASRIGEWFGPHNACWMVKACMELELMRLQARIDNGKLAPMTHRELDDDTQDSFGSDLQRAYNVSATVGAEAAVSALQFPTAFSVPKIYVSDDGTLYRDRIEALVRPAGYQPPAPPAVPAQEADTSSPPPAAVPAAMASTGPPVFSADFHPLLILIPLRLGVDKLNPAYVPSLLSMFQSPQCVGIIGGKPRSSLYFIGVQDERLFYLDPHTVQPAADLTGANSLRDGTAAVKQAIAATYHCSRVMSIPVASIDPSLAIGFYLDNQASFDDFWEMAKNLADVSRFIPGSSAMAKRANSDDSDSDADAPATPASHFLPVFHVAEVSPNYACLDDSDDDGGSDCEDSGDEVDDDARSDSGSRIEAAADQEQQETFDADTEFAAARSLVPQPPPTEESPPPVFVDTSSLPKDHNGVPLSLDSLTTSPVFCPHNGSSDGLPPVSLASSLEDEDSALQSAPSSLSSAATAASNSVSALTGMTLALSSAAAKSLTSFGAQVASSAQQQLHQLAHSAQQLQASARNKLARSESPAAEGVGVGAGDSTPVVVPLPSTDYPALNATSPSTSKPAGAASGQQLRSVVASPSAAAAPRRGSVGSSLAAAASTPPSASKSKSGGKAKVKSSRLGRRGSRDNKGGDEDDSWLFL